MVAQPRLSLEFRPVRIGWLVQDRDLSQICTAVGWTTCLWGGAFNPIIPIEDRDLSEKLVRLFGVDLLYPIKASDATTAFIERHQHLGFGNLTRTGPFKMFTNALDVVFSKREFAFVDVRHVARRAQWTHGIETKQHPISVALPRWLDEDPFSALLTVLFGCYPNSENTRLDFGSSLLFRSNIQSWIEPERSIPKELIGHVCPVELTKVDLFWRQPDLRWHLPGIVVGSATDFNDLLLFWNLRAAGVPTCFYDQASDDRLKSFVSAFLKNQLNHVHPALVNVWSKTSKLPKKLERTNIIPNCHTAHFSTIRDDPWNGKNIAPVKPLFSPRARDVIPTCGERVGQAFASFTVPELPFTDADDARQQFIITVEVSRYGEIDADFTFETPYVPRLNKFYGSKFYFAKDSARAELGSLNRGAVGIIAAAGTQNLEVKAISVHEWFQCFFSQFGVAVERSQPGLLCKRLIAQLGSLQGCRVLKVRGLRELIRSYRPDQAFPLGAAVQCIGEFDNENKMRFQEFQDLNIHPGQRGKLTPNEVLQYLTSRGLFRVGLEFTCPNCELAAWVHLDNVETNTTCEYCGLRFDVTPQLKDRTWRYRRSGLFGRADDQQGSIPVALALQQLEASLRRSLLMYSTALIFRPHSKKLETCEADFVAAVAGNPDMGEAPVQILLGEAKTNSEFDDRDLRNSES